MKYLLLIFLLGGCGYKSTPMTKIPDGVCYSTGGFRYGHINFNGYELQYNRLGIYKGLLYGLSTAKSEWFSEDTKFLECPKFQIDQSAIDEMKELGIYKGFLNVAITI
jgi:hypothetical protein